MLFRVLFEFFSAFKRVWAREAEASAARKQREADALKAKRAAEAAREKALKASENRPLKGRLTLF